MPESIPSAGSMQNNKTGHPSGVWWLLPILFGWLGGIIAWAVIKESNGGRARQMLGLGFFITFLWIGVAFMLSGGLALSDFSFD
ncbi:MAG: hypothetical protein P3T54_06225 [Dehalogenimonas sp.]|uniref:Uncharacterized protein n=1 Tax=Candidatus Dehalogenimonas loeffleri TaxID=3127115 RepID=A0ABZ2J4E8_9CHLR|nr:hypothetical protein [Dehalogenimonas sp.]